MGKLAGIALFTLTLVLASCAAAPGRPKSWSAAEPIVAPSSFAGVHGLAIDAKGRLLAGSVVGGSIWEVDRRTGAARVLIPPPEGEADDIAVGPNGELAWSSFLQGVLRYRANDDAPVRVLAEKLPGINSLDFDRARGKLYASQVFMGDALWEIDIAGTKPPRLIVADVGGFNGFEVGPDGMLYGPLWFKHQVVKIDPVTGAITPISSDFQTPAAANLDGKGGLWVVDARTGELSRVELATGRKTVAKKLRPALDNLAIAPEGTIYVSNMADNSIEAFEPSTGEVRVLTSGQVPVAAGLRVEGDRLWIAGLFALREVDLRSGNVTDVMRMWASDIEYPSALGLSPAQLVLASGLGSVQRVARATMKVVTTGHGFKAPADVLAMPDGSVLVAESGSGSILRVTGAALEHRDPLVTGLQNPMQMTLARDGALYVTQAGGTLLRVDLAARSITTVASGLALPKGVAETPWGSLVVLEAASRQLVEIDPGTGERRTIASNLPVGMPGMVLSTGVAVDSDGNIYFSADANNGIYKLRPLR